MAERTFIDLFCGCGGFTLGLQRAGFKGLAAVDFEPNAIKIYQSNFPNIGQVLEKDLTQFTPQDLEKLIGTKSVDLIVGGPPCQGFSTARQVDGANHGTRLKEDPRRVLYKKFLDHVAHFQPKVFVMENVLGIRSTDGGIYFSKVQAEARALGYKVHAQIEKCVTLGLPQKRRRQLFIGTRDDLPGYFHPRLQPADHAMLGTTLWEAIGDLPSLVAGKGNEESNYDFNRRKNISGNLRAQNYVFNVLEVEKAETLTAHRARPHNERDLGDFKKLKTGESSAEAMRRGVEFDFPYDKTSFKDRFTRQPKNGPCSTIVAHLSKDGLMFIHPTQNRSLTPREAARIQSFPDWFKFPVARTHQFKAIGNAVPPLVSEAVGNAIESFLSQLETKSLRKSSPLFSLPKTDKEAAKRISATGKLSRNELLECSLQEIKSTWYSIGFLYMGLHPDSALDHGSEITIREPRNIWEKRNSDLISPYYVRSGWPLFLEAIAEESWRRYESGELSEDEFYCSDAQRAGAGFRNTYQNLSA